MLFADLRGSTGLFERLGNAPAAAQVAERIAALVALARAHHGQAVKTLGDGLMAVFAEPVHALQAAEAMQQAAAHAPADGARRLALRLALSHGELVAVGEDWLGDGLNVAARLLDRAGDEEILASAELVAALDGDERARFQRLGPLHLRGRQAPVQVYRLPAALQRGATALTVAFEASRQGGVPAQAQRLSLRGEQLKLSLGPADLPISLGRDRAATVALTQPRVSRSHARIEWREGSFELIDLSANGSFLRFLGEDGKPGELRALHRSLCALRGQGLISLGGPPGSAGSAMLAFQVEPGG
ncbi:adenylate/guanylate cyclase domain-containing protein [Piscinibacter sp. Jin2]|uniref:Adenylate/guanylate cyclase domain-containing protein n=1 Tax=Aquariibacter lacus TaxID=2801332 RepID=A0A9X0XDT3_9BURK|nr:adenylate/guanylate cyclase domain-containing protein [Piscinibacter lacus]